MATHTEIPTITITRIFCAADRCNTPAATITTDGLTVIARHHGERHTNIVKVDDLIAALRVAIERGETTAEAVMTALKTA